MVCDRERGGYGFIFLRRWSRFFCVLFLICFVLNFGWGVMVVSCYGDVEVGLWSLWILVGSKWLVNGCLDGLFGDGLSFKVLYGL